MIDDKWVTFLSDYGLGDHLVGVCRGVIVRIAPDAKIIDLTHQVKPQNVNIGAMMLAEALPYVPVGIHLALIDPYRLARARGIAVRCRDGSTLVCPDNGLSSLAWPVLGGVEAVRQLSNSELWNENPSRSFRGRDVFAPVAAHLAAGLPLEKVGPEIDPETLVALEPARPQLHDDHVHAEIRMIDHFGNLQLTVQRADLEMVGIVPGDMIELRFGGKRVEVPFSAHFGDVPPGGTVICEDSFGTITIVVNMGRADSVLRANAGDRVVLSRVHHSAIVDSGPLPVVDQAPVPTYS